MRWFEVSEEKTINDIKGLVRASLKINGLSLLQKEKFCEVAKQNFNDSYSAYLTYLLQKSEDYDRLLNFEDRLKQITDLLMTHEKEINELSKRIKELEGKVVENGKE